MTYIFGDFDNGTDQCCKYCENFALWGVSTGYCTEKCEDMLSWDDACESFKKENNYPPYNCVCGNYEEEKRDIYAEECYGIVEYRAYCKNCGAYIGHFVYGQWMLD